MRASVQIRDSILSKSEGREEEVAAMANFVLKCLRATQEFLMEMSNKD